MWKVVLMDTEMDVLLSVDIISKLCLWHCFGCLDNCLRGELPPGYFPPPPDKCSPGWFSPWLLPSRQSPPEQNCPPDSCCPDNCPHGKLPPDNRPLDDCSRTFTPKIIDKYDPGNCPRGKLPFRWFVAYIIVPRKTDPKNIVPLVFVLCGLN